MLLSEVGDVIAGEPPSGADSYFLRCSGRGLLDIALAIQIRGGD